MDTITATLGARRAGRGAHDHPGSDPQNRARQERRPADLRHARHDLEHLVRRHRDHRHAEPGLRHPGSAAVVEGAADRARPHDRARRLHRRLDRAGAGRARRSPRKSRTGSTSGRRSSGPGRSCSGRWCSRWWRWRSRSIYYYAPDAEQDWIWITPGSVLATLLWLVISLGFKFYVSHFASYNATYGAIGGVIVLMLWFYVSALAVLVGAELNAEIEHASPVRQRSRREGCRRKEEDRRAGRARMRPTTARRHAEAGAGRGRTATSTTISSAAHRPRPRRARATGC